MSYEAKIWGRGKFRTEGIQSHHPPTTKAYADSCPPCHIDRSRLLLEQLERNPAPAVSPTCFLHLPTRHPLSTSTCPTLHSHHNPASATSANPSTLQCLKSPPSHAALIPNHRHFPHHFCTQGAALRFCTKEKEIHENRFYIAVDDFCAPLEGLAACNVHICYTLAVRWDIARQRVSAEKGVLAFGCLDSRSWRASLLRRTVRQGSGLTRDTEVASIGE